MSNFNKYTGRPYEMGKADCYGLVREYMWEEYQFNLPSLARPTRFWENPDLNLPDVYREYGFRPVLDDTYALGDLLLVSLQTVHPVHFALVVGDNLILHHVIGQLSSVDPLRPRWSNRASYVIRHPELYKKLQPKRKVLQLHEVIDAHVLRNPAVQKGIDRISGGSS